MTKKHKITQEHTFEEISENIVSMALTKTKDAYKQQTYNLINPMVQEFSLDSLDLVELIVDVETEYDIEISQDALNIDGYQNESKKFNPEQQLSTLSLIIIVATVLGVNVPYQYKMKQEALRPLLKQQSPQKKNQKHKKHQAITSIVVGASILLCLAGVAYFSKTNTPQAQKTHNTEKQKTIQTPSQILKTTKQKVH